MKGAKEAKVREEQIDPAVKLQEFLKKEKLVLTPVPQFLHRDDGTFSVVCRIEVKQLG